MNDSISINIVIPMAGLGSRFSKNGYTKPKPFIDVSGKPMIVRVLDNLYYKNARYILIVRKEHLLEEKETFDYIRGNYNVVLVSCDALTEGTACSVLLAEKHIDNTKPLLIANSDQIIDESLEVFINDCFARSLDGSILTFIDNEKDPKWSFASIDGNGMVLEVKEKVSISDIATVGIYLYSHGKDYVKYSKKMIANNDRVNGEFYTCPVYNYAISDDLKIGVYNIPVESMHGIGTPDDLNAYLDKKR